MGKIKIQYGYKVLGSTLSGKMIVADVRPSNRLGFVRAFIKLILKKLVDLSA